MQFTPTGLEPVDQNWGAMMGPSAPQLCAVLAADSRTYATGDVVWYDTAPATQYPVVAALLSQALNPPVAFRSIVKPAIGVIVAVSPGTPQAPTVSGALPIVPAGTRGSDTLVWVLPALRRKFTVVGDSKTPQIAVENIGRGGVTADLVYAAPVGGRSGVALDGSSFNARSATTLCVEAMAPGMDPAPGAKYLVTFRPR